MKFSALRVAVTIFAIPFLVIAASAAPGDLDLTFSQDGKRYDHFLFGGNDRPYGSVVQSDGKIAIVGDASFGAVNTCGITRYNADGTLDSTFDGDGRVVLPAGLPLECSDIAIQGDGKIVVVGNRVVSSDHTYRIFRLNSDGSFDLTFDSDGIVTTRLPGTSDAEAHAVLVQPDGRIVVGGTSDPTAGNLGDQMTLVRYTSDGLLDPSFDGDGIAAFSAAPTASRVFDIVLQPDGKIIAAGDANDFSFLVNYYATVRVNPNGSLDQTFDGDGIAARYLSPGVSIAFAVALQPDGKIVTAGVADMGGQRQFESFVVRHNIDGSFDNSFSGDGIFIEDDTNSTETANTIAIQPDGKIVTAGQTGQSVGPPENAMLWRYNSDGSPDGSFDNDGRVITDLPSGSTAFEGVHIQPDAKLVAVGYVTNGISRTDFALIRYHASGALDPSFDSDGIANDDVGYQPSVATAVAIQLDKKIVVGGYTTIPGQSRFAVARYNADGTNDHSFGSGGKLTTDVLPGIDEIRGIAIQPDGKIVAVGFAGRASSTSAARDGAVVRYNPDGSLDTSFDLDGKAIFNFGLVDVANAIAIQPDGKIVVAGMSSQPDDSIMVARFNTDGSLDNTFDSDGRVFLSLPDSDYITSLALQPDGKIVGAGRAHNGVDADFAVVRFNANGTPDASFDMDGLVITAVRSNWDEANAVAIQPDGKIVAAGLSLDTVDTDFATVRYKTDGTLDDSFGQNGKIVTAVTAGSNRANAVVIERTGKIIVAGYATTSGPVNDSSEFALVRYTPAGVIDTTFGASGMPMFDLLGGSSDVINGVALDSNGRVVAVGSTNSNFAVARVQADFIPDTHAPFDFDGDGMTDIGIFRPNAAGEWWINRSSTGATFALQFGAATDRIAPADYTGDGKADITFWRPSTGEWYVLRSEDNSFFAFPLGANGDIPVPADYDADGKADAAIFRPSSGTWFISQSGGGGTRIFQFGSNGDQPVVSDYDGDGKADVGIFRAAAGGAEWWIDRSTAGLLAMQFGASTDKAVQGDYTGDGKTDIAIWRPASGEWFIVRSEDFSFFAFPFGASGDVIAPGDYDGDGNTDPTVFRPAQATWYIARSTAGTQIVQFGANGDQPIPNAFVP